MPANTYKDTLNLPRTDFPMKANLVQREPDTRRRWREMDLYGLLRAAAHPKGRYVLHDGPPYANGDIHIGTAVNKVLKDIVVKYRTMQGFDSPFVPGWDCHGQPIEHKVRQELGAKADALVPEEIRQRCAAYAERYIALQSKQFQALGVFGRFDRPYVTMAPAYEQRQMEVLAALADEGLIYRDLRAIHWCASCRTALAEAELEYQDDTGPSLYVLFQVFAADDEAQAKQLGLAPLSLLNRLGQEPLYLMVWTTTPWTLPANLAVAVHPNYQYSAVRFRQGMHREFVAFVASDLKEQVADAAELKLVEVIAECDGLSLLGLTYKHPFMGAPPGRDGLTEQDLHGQGTRARQVHTDPAMVTLEEGTGLVHSAPGHGREDNLMGMRAGLPAYSPVDADGRFDETVPEPLRGRSVLDDETQEAVYRLLGDHLVAPPAKHLHRYPHCWRCRNPVIFRATEQWFVALDKSDEGKSLRQRALEAVGGVQWVPAWSESRIRAMIETRPDWCISRQKVWGVPIPAVYCDRCGRAVLTGDMMRAAGACFGRFGSGAWARADLADVFGSAPVCPDCGSKATRKETDVFDVWLDSGASWAGVCEAEDLGMPVDLYLEGSDQHRGWFQSSLILGVVARKEPPFRTCITHGFVVDEEGRKMSKSLGNAVSVLDEVGRLGADVVRLWVSSVDYAMDIRASDALIAGLQDAYRKVRNTLRFLLGNVSDFDPRTDAVAPARLEELDRWMLARTQQVIAEVTAAMEAFEFHRVYQLIHVFCVNDLSAFYLDVQKDALYCDAPSWPRRRSAQTAVAYVADALVRMLAPVLVHTAEEAWGHLPAGAERPPSVHLAAWPAVDARLLDEELLAHGAYLLDVRRDAYALLEVFRQRGRFAKHSEARAALAVADAQELADLRAVGEERLANLLMLSECRLVSPEEAAALKGERVEGAEAGVRRFAAALLLEQTHRRCERCWNWRPSVGRGQPADLCDRCRKALAARS